MIELEEASILYLDDQINHLKHTQKEFKEKGFNLETTQSVEVAKQKAIASEVDIFICDLRMEKLSPQKGNEILKQIRKMNSDVFLVLFSAYTKELTEKEFDIMEENNIYHYGKDNSNRMMISLKDDFKNFQAVKASAPILGTNKNAPTNDEIMTTLKSEITASLRRISNQDLLLPVKGYDSLRVREIANEVDSLSDLGRVFIKEWVKSTSKYKL